MTRRVRRRCYPRRFNMLRLEDRITPAITTTWDPTYGALSVSSDGADSITLGTNSDRRVTVNGTAIVDSSLLTIESRLVQSITVSGGPFGNLINLSQVEPLTFSGLSNSNGGLEVKGGGTGLGAGKANFHDFHIVINGGGGADTITGSQFGDLIDCFQGADQIDGGFGDDVFYIRNDDVSGITINGGYGDNSLEVDYTKISLAKMQISLNFASSGKDSLSYGGKNIVMTGISATNVQDAIDELEFVLTYPAGPGGGGGSVDLSAKRGIAVDIRLSPTQPTGPGGVFSFEASKVGMTGVADGFAVRADAGSVPLAINLTGTGNSLIVNTFDLGSTTTPTSVQVSGMAPITFSGMSAVSTEVRLYDGAAMADLKALGVIILPTVTVGPDGIELLSLSVTNNNPVFGLKTEWITSIGLPKVTPKISKESHGRVAPPGRIIGVIPGVGVNVEFHDTVANLPAAHLAAGMEWDQEATFHLPDLGPGQSSTNATICHRTSSAKKPFSIFRPNSQARFSIGTTNYVIDLSSYFETSDEPTQSQFASVIDSTTGKTPSGGSTTLIGVDASGQIVLASSSASNIDSHVTAMTAGAHLYAGQQMVDVAFNGTASGNASATVADMDLTGRYVVFESAATNLVASSDTNGGTDIFLRDTLLGKTIRLSGTGTSAGNGASFDPHISANGHFVIFRSSATNIVPGVIDTNGEADLFSYDVVTGALNCMSLVPNTSQTCNKGVITADVNGDSLSDYTVAYLTAATNTAFPDPGMHLLTVKPYLQVRKCLDCDPDWDLKLSAGITVSTDSSTVVMWTDASVSHVTGIPDTNGTRDIVAFNVDTGVCTPVSVNYLGTAMADGPSPAYAGEAPAVSVDGSHIAFTSTSSNLISGLTAPATDGVYRFAAGTTTPVERIDITGASSYGGNNHDPSISGDGLGVAWSSTTNYDSSTGSSSSFRDWYNKVLNGKTDRRTVLLSGQFTDPNTPSNGDASKPLICASGALVLFSSTASDLVPGDNNGQSDVFASSAHDTYRFQLLATDPADVTLQYNSMADSYQIVNTVGGGVVTELKASDGKKHFEVTSNWKSPSQRTITINTGSGLQRLGGNIIVHGDTGNEKVILLGPPGVAVQTDLRASANGSASAVIWRDLGDGGFLSDREMTGVVAVACTDGVDEIVNKTGAATITYRNDTTNTDEVIAVGLDLKVVSGGMTLTTADFYASSARQAAIVLSPGNDSCSFNFTGLAASAPTNVTVFGNGGSDTFTQAGAPITDQNQGVWIDNYSDSDCFANGTAGNDTITIGSNAGTLDGGAGNDVYMIGGRYKVGTVPIPITIQDSTGDDSLDFSLSSGPVVVDLDSTAAQPFVAGSVLSLNGAIENAIGSPFDDTFFIKLSSTPRSIDGGSNVTTAGDTLIVDAQGKATTAFGGKVINSSGQYAVYRGEEQLDMINNAPTLQVAAIEINDGAVQRSMVRKITVGFNGLVSFPFPGGAASAFSLTSNTTGTPVTIIVTPIDADGFTRADITFPAGGPDYGSLPNGAFTLHVLGSQIASLLSPLDGNGDGTINPGGEDYASPSTLIFRTFGDSNGDRVTNLTDFAAFRGVFNLGASEMFDLEGDGNVSLSDFAGFRGRFNLLV